MFFVGLLILAPSSVSLAANGLGIAEGGDF